MPAPSRTAGTASLALTVDQGALADVAKLLKGEADGKLMRRELTKSLRKTAEKPIAAAKREILAAPSAGLAAQGQPLRATVARSIKPVVRLSGARTGVSIRQTKTRGMRGFANAGRKFNKPTFRHPVYGNTEKWVAQKTYSAGWFDRPMNDARPDFRADVLNVVQNLADTLAARIAART